MCNVIDKCVNPKLIWKKNYDTKPFPKKKKKASLHARSTCDEASINLYRLSFNINYRSAFNNQYILILCFHQGRKLNDEKETGIYQFSWRIVTWLVDKLNVWCIFILFKEAN